MAYYCSRCNRYFATDRALWQHEDNSSMHNVCHTCNKDFPSAWGLIQHYVQSPIHDYCQPCDEHFSSLQDLLSHYHHSHWYCTACNQILNSELGLHEHNRQKHSSRYCVSCKRVFNSESNLDAHMRSSTHQPKTVQCPGRNCGKLFVSYAALILHLEAGTCPSNINRDTLNRLVAQTDKNNIITNPSRLIRGPDGQNAPPRSAVTDMWATERSWNGYCYECCLCHRTYASLTALNAHLRSPAHADKIYRCPRQANGCGAEFKTLSAFWQHMESGQCGVCRFRREIDSVMDSLTSRMGRLMAA